MCSGAVEEFAPEILTIAALKYLDPLTDCIRIGACKNSSRLTEMAAGISRRVPAQQSPSETKPKAAPKVCGEARSD